MGTRGAPAGAGGGARATEAETANVCEVDAEAGVSKNKKTTFKNIIRIYIVKINIKMMRIIGVGGWAHNADDAHA